MRTSTTHLFILLALPLAAACSGATEGNFDDPEYEAYQRCQLEAQDNALEDCNWQAAAATTERNTRSATITETEQPYATPHQVPTQAPEATAYVTPPALAQLAPVAEPTEIAHGEPLAPPQRVDQGEPLAPPLPEAHGEPLAPPQLVDQGEPLAPPLLTPYGIPYATPTYVDAPVPPYPGQPLADSPLGYGGFEDLSQWSSPRGIAFVEETKAVTEGLSALRFTGGNGRQHLRSGVFNTGVLNQVSDTVTLDVLVEGQARDENFWVADVELQLNCPVVNISGLSLGNAEVGGDEIGNFVTLQFGVPQDVELALATPGLSCRVEVLISSLNGAEDIVLDRLAFE